MHAHMKASTARAARDLGPFVPNDRAPDLASMLGDNVAGKGCHP